MKATQFVAALEVLGWTQTQAAEELGVKGGQPRVSQWMTGKRKVPEYIGRALMARLELARHSR